MKTFFLLFLVALGALTSVLVQSPRPAPNRVDMAVTEIEVGHLSASLR
jgi:hypothetical protein